MPDHVGVVVVPGYVEPVIYHLEPGYRYVEQPYHAGGVMRMPIATGRWMLEAVRHLGRDPFPITPAIRAAVLADCRLRGIDVEATL